MIALRRWGWLRIVVHAGALAPLAVLIGRYAQGQLGPDAIDTALRRTGDYALALLGLTLLPTALNLLFGLRQAVAVRRTIGLYAFFYAALHLLVFLGPDYGFDLGLALQAISQGRNELTGTLVFLILIPLAATSTDAAVKRLGAAWRRLHLLTYLAAALAVLHYAWSFKELRRLPLIAAVALVLLLLLRLPPVARFLSAARRGPACER